MFWGGPSLASAQKLDGRLVSSGGFPRWLLMAGSLATGLVSPGRDCLEGIGRLVSLDPTRQRVRCPGGPHGLSNPKEEEEEGPKFLPSYVSRNQERSDEPL